ncbi:hypothetical protein EVAR_55087_1 [Eumeta japonica]|uniref:Uncharacterized protein n=1 Tax=Eumeta variegata TaxID=151549 RepID=A0A4C1YK88_EUMVA|nr:hypothetical protein EVAR_55087_1 [Eumeta japonica]
MNKLRGHVEGAACARMSLFALKASSSHVDTAAEVGPTVARSTASVGRGCDRPTPFVSGGVRSVIMPCPEHDG